MYTGGGTSPRILDLGSSLVVIKVWSADPYNPRELITVSAGLLLSTQSKVEVKCDCIRHF